MASISAQLFRPVVHQIGKQLAAADHPKRIRNVFGRTQKLLLPSPRTQTTRVQLGRVDSLRIAANQNPTARRQVLMFHGGGYVFGSARAYAAMAGRFAKAAAVEVYVPEYRLAPEHPYPAAINDGLAAYRALLEHNDAANIALVGDSAGGNLVLALLHRARDTGLAMPACAVMLSPWLDLTGSGESMRSNVDSEILIFPETIARCAHWYCGDSNASDPGISPLFASQAVLPPMLVQVSANEMLYSDSTRFAERATASGGQVCLQTEPDLWHVWQLMAPGLPEARRSIASAGEFIAEHTGGAGV